MRRFLLIFSICFNLLLAGAFLFLVQRMGGWQYAFYRLRHDESGLYANRKSLFQQFPDKPGAIVMLGDSQIEQCEWGELLNDSLPVLNRGISGDHVDGVWNRLDDVLRNRPSKVFVCVGINDLLFKKPPESIEARYREIVGKIRAQTPDAQLVLISVLPLNNDIKKFGLQNADIQAFNQRIAKIARDYALPYLDLSNQLSDANGNLRSACTTDGIHLNGQGYLVWKKAMEKL